MSLFWRVFATNAALLVAAALVLGFSPVTISAPLAVTEAAVLVVGVAGMLAANLLLLRPWFAPLEALARRMKRVDLLRPGQRLPVQGVGETAALVHAFNEMLDRLETERRESGRRVLAAQEGERKRIAAGLHDEVGQTMTGVLLLLERLLPAVSAERRHELVDAQDAVRASLDDVRRIARELRPETLEHLGLVSALTALSQGFAERTGLEVQRRFEDGLPALAPDAELALYRVAQESLTNVARHAGASRVDVVLEHGRDSIVLRVVDDGRGLDGHLEEGGGLRGMRERALTVRAALAVKPSASGGVEVRLEVPAGGGA